MMTTSRVVVIGLGSNLDDRLATLREAVRRIDRDVAPVRARSGVWETVPIGGPPQDDFLNAAIAIDWPLDQKSPTDLLRALMSIETELGRVRSVPNGPRTLDLDILWIDGATIDEPPDLIVPHPRLHERAFALAPLLEVAPDAPFSLATALDQRVKRVGDL